jgi:dTDP-4-dehydrorhamnose 3,5-epimerase
MPVPLTPRRPRRLPEPVLGFIVEVVGAGVSSGPMQQKRQSAPAIPDVIAGPELVAKQSAVNEQGKLRGVPIEGVLFRPARPVPHEDGYVTEVARANWDMLADPIVQVHITTTLPGRVRAWGLHQASTDRLFVVSGLVKIVIFDGRNGSPTHGRINEFTISERNPALVVIPPDLYHGWKNISTDEAIIINMPTNMYNYEAPDALDMPWDSELAERVVPYRW